MQLQHAHSRNIQTDFPSNMTSGERVQGGSSRKITELNHQHTIGTLGPPGASGLISPQSPTMNMVSPHVDMKGLQ